MASDTYSMDNPVFGAFMFYATVVIVKTMVMSGITAYHRMTKKVYANEEDTVNPITGKKIPTTTHPAVERVRRCHQNDLENVIPFVLLGFLYVGTNPSMWAALLHFRIFTAARLLHTIVYLNVVPQPARVLTFLVGLIVTFSMAVNVFKAGTF